MSINAIETSGLSKSFRGVRAVLDVDLHVPAGSVYGLVGKNGAGKSTLLKLVSGLTPQDRGTVCVGGRQLRPGESDPRLGVLVEAPAVYGRLDAFENLMNRALISWGSVPVTRATAAGASSGRAAPTSTTSPPASASDSAWPSPFSATRRSCCSTSR